MKEKKSKHGKRLIGIILIILQIMAFYGSIVINKSELPSNLIGWISFCIFGIIGIVLIIEDCRESKKWKKIIY
mgnify:CR=1 FL=1